MKRFFITLNRERNVARFSESSDQKDAVIIIEKGFMDLLKENGYSEYQAEKMISGIKNNPFNDWIQW